MTTLKKCTKCGEEKPATKEFFRIARGYKDGLRSVCKKCGHKANKEWKKTTKGKAAAKRYMNKYRDSGRAYQKQQEYRHTKKGRLTRRRAGVSACGRLTDRYVKKLLRETAARHGIAIGSKDIHENIVDLKRIHITLKRIQNERKKEQPVNP